MVNFIGCHQGLRTSCSQFKELGKVEEDGVGHHRDDKVSGCVFMPAIKLIRRSFLQNILHCEQAQYGASSKFEHGCDFITLSCAKQIKLDY